MYLRHWLVAAGTTVAVIASGGAATGVAAPGADTGQQARTLRAGDATSAIEKRRVDAVPTPKLGWYPCFQGAECATVRLPLDYDKPKGATTEVAVLRLKARKPKQRIGTLFVNPGGPGAQGTVLAFAAPEFLSPAVLDRFDIVGFDPRGIGFSDNVTCFKSVHDQTLALTGMAMSFPFGARQEKAYTASAKKLGAGCSTVGQPLAGSMSTAEVARDMDVLRRAVGDAKLSYLGFSYGTALGQYYANMFPDRLRVAALDGVINPTSWVGTKKTAGQILDDRAHTADGAAKALHEILVRCGKAGKSSCNFAKFGDPVQQFAVLAGRLQARPVAIESVKVTYTDLIGGVLGDLYDPVGYALIETWATDLYEASNPRSSAATAAAARRRLATLIAENRARVERAKGDARRATAQMVGGRDFAYDNGLDAYSGVTCTDARHPTRTAVWPGQAAAADRRAPYFGRLWDWSTVQCAGDAWSAHDEDAYTGPFNRHTRAPVLFVGNYYDPATNYSEAVSASKLLPGSRLLSSNSWGHTAYGTSACATTAVDRYLLKGTLPAAGTVCVGDDQPFDITGTAAARKLRPAADPSLLITGAGAAARTDSVRHLPPVATRVPPSVLLGTR